MSQWKLTMAWPKGRLGEAMEGMMTGAGFNMGDQGRRLWWLDTGSMVRFLELKPIDVVTVVERGVADLGVVGKDVLLEYPARFAEIMDLQVGSCRLCLAAPDSLWPGGDLDWPQHVGQLLGGRQVLVATRYPRLTGQLLRELGVDAEIIGMAGSVELAPAMGLADIICDLVSSGNTLRANGLVEIAELLPISARLIANPGALHLKSPHIRQLCTRLASQLGDRGVAS